MGKGAISAGIVFIIFGIWLLTKTCLAKEKWLLLYPLVIIAIGIALIIFNKEEDKIEQRKDFKEKKTK